VDHPPKRFEQPCGTATDPHGDIYVASAGAGLGEGTEGRIDVFDPQGNYLTEIHDEHQPCDVSVDSKGNVYVAEYAGKAAVRFEPSAYPPPKGSEYGPRAVVHEQNPGDLCGGSCTSAWSVAVDPSNDHLYVGGLVSGVLEYDSAANGQALLREDIGAELNDLVGVDIYGKTHQVYSTGSKPGGEAGNPEDARVFILNPAGDEVKCEIDGAETPQGGFGWVFGTTSIAVDQSNGDVYVGDFDASTRQVVDQFDSDCKYLGQIEHSFKKTQIGIGLSVGIDTPCLDALGEPCGGKAYDSPNAGELYVGQGNSGSTYRVYAFKPPVGAPEFPLTVSKAGSGEGTVTSTPSGIECGAVCAAEFEEGAEVTLTASPAGGSSFAGWSGAGCSGTGTCEVTMSEAQSVTAEFTEAAAVLHTLTVTVEGEGEVSADSGTISGCTSSGGAACEGSYEEGATVTLTETPAEGSLFAGWGTPQCDESTESTCAITIGVSDEGVAAGFEAEEVEEPGIPLKVALEGTGTGTVSSDPGLISCDPFCEDEYEPGAKVTLTASPSPSSLFMAWKHCDSGGINGRQCTVTMDKAKEVSALFIVANSLTLAKAEGSGPGKLASKPGGVNCPYACLGSSALFKEGTALSVTATPAKHFHLASFAGDCEGKGPCELVMGEDHEVSTLFAEDAKYALSIAKTGGGQAFIKTKPSGIICGFTCGEAEAEYYEGEMLEVSVKLNKGTTSLEWTSGAGTCTGTIVTTEATCTVTMSAAHELVAKFE
jgi:hypothetical protein